jgi:hypothetical protein
MTRPGIGKLHAFESSAYDLTQAHNYWGSGTVSIPADAAALRELRKPMILGEYGLDAEGKLEEQDPKGYHLWEASWVALASGFGGGAMSWWWDTYLRPKDLFKTQLAMARVVAAVDLRGVHDPLPEDVIVTDAAGESLNLFGRLGKDRMLLVVRHPDSYWKTANAKGMPEVSGAYVVLPGPAAVLWKARFFDSWTGAVVQTAAVQSDDRGIMQVVVPRFTGAIVIELQAQPPQIVGATGGCSIGRRSSGLAGCAALVGALLGSWLIVSRKRMDPRKPMEPRP